MFYLNMVDYAVFFPLPSTLTWDTCLTLWGTHGFYLNHVIPLGPSKSCRVGGGDFLDLTWAWTFDWDLASGFSIATLV